MMQKILSVLLIMSVLMLSACQSLRPKAQGLPTWQQLQQLQQQAQTQQDQVDIQWKAQSFSFLLYQQQTAEYLQIIALSVSGQILFELHYDGQQLKVIQCIDAMKYLPFDFLMRDIFWGTLPADVVEKQSTQIGLNFAQEQQNSEIKRIILHNNQKKLQVLIQDKKIIIDNLTVPYQLTLYRSQQDFFQNE